MERVLLFQDMSDMEYAKLVEQHVAALNKALEGIPADRVRLHVCWGNWEGPHVHDVAMEVILPALYQANVGALGLEFANPRRQHESATLSNCKLPDKLILIPGVIDPKTNFVEHPEVVAQRIGAVVAAVDDRERVIAGVDCALALSSAGNGHRGCRVGQAGDIARRSGPRLETAMGQEGGLSPIGARPRCRLTIWIERECAFRGYSEAESWCKQSLMIWTTAWGLSGANHLCDPLLAMS
jgi:hypothetical protein